MKLVAISDLHGTLPAIPECDVLVIAGDVCPIYDHSPAGQQLWLRGKFTKWLEFQPAKEIIGIGGNHDFQLELDKDLAYSLSWHYLLDQSIELMGHKFHGYPWVPNLPSWAFHGDSNRLYASADGIPEDTDVLITHGPPAGVGDKVSHTHVGDTHLANALSYKVQPRLHIFGHIHEGRGRHTENNITLANVTILDRDYRHVHPVMEFDL